MFSVDEATAKAIRQMCEESGEPSAALDANHARDFAVG